jgi:hypothetical protein
MTRISVAQMIDDPRTFNRLVEMDKARTAARLARQANPRPAPIPVAMQPDSSERWAAMSAAVTQQKIEEPRERDKARFMAEVGAELARRGIVQG